MASLLSAILFLAVSSSFSHQIAVAERCQSKISVSFSQRCGHLSSSPELLIDAVVSSEGLRIPLLCFIALCGGQFCSSIPCWCLTSVAKRILNPARKELRSKLTEQIAPVLSNRIDPSRVVQISWQPRSGFSSTEALSQMRSAHKGKKGDDISKDKTKATGIMNSSYVKDNVVSVIEERISAWSFLPHGTVPNSNSFNDVSLYLQENSRSLQVQHYTSERATGKYDYIGSTSTLERNEPLMATVILYLSNATQGGELVFPDSTVSDRSYLSAREKNSIQKEVKSSEWLKPTKGNAILFFNVHPNTSPDKSSSHERRPLVNGELWCAVKLLYMRPIITEDLSAGSNDGECTDQDDDCPQWAARGECERNPVYMVGSPDYFGTCRKSCKVC
ncbi:hypothetical protein V2J09_011236 [Rumex salicifolius]